MRTRAEPPRDRPAWLSHNLIVLCAVSFLQDAASELLYPILPIFLTSVLGAPVAVVGAVEGIAEGAASITRLVSGRLADSARRRPLIAAGYGLAAAGKLVIAFSSVWPMVLVGRAVDRLGKGMRGAPRDALLVQGVPAAARGKAFGLHRAMDSAGAVAGPLAGLGMYELLGHRIRPLLIVAVLPAVASVLLVAAVREQRTPPARAADAAARATHPNVGLGSQFWSIAAPLTAFAFINFPDALLLLRVRELGFSVAAVIGGYAAYNLAYALLSYPAGALSDRLPRSRIFAVGLICFAVAYLGLGLIRDPGWAWLLLIIYGGFPACTDGVGKAWISSSVPLSRQGSAQGIFQGLSGLGVLAAGVWAGLSWGQDGKLPLLISGVSAAILAATIGVRGRSPEAAPRPVPQS